MKQPIGMEYDACHIALHLSAVESNFGKKADVL